MSNPATNQQVQAFVDGRLRGRVQQIRALQLNMLDDIAAIGDVYAAVTEQSPTWSDQRTDGPPHLMTPADVLSINAFLNNISAAIAADGNYVTVKACCVNPPIG